ncbi:ankyrin repeat domain-containing protein [Burkholderia cenocepacia]|uniref:ankyrin repeat domain-containing protein n=1 Tax=Burkholderia cenocepacia TaxID=95486 RepID=UPI000F58067B|nr:ankyrin repeat domain-containing protein [Burkholderia cenocepacia]RQU36071.1 ankyrin repeat domain-containing protein [Burkholderia cenocepacia]RQU61334.1 ankyrin repeat domain-containing protein [Burkholderia cenocepacia]
MSANSPSKYFEGSYLSAAKAISDGDVAQLKSALSGIDVNRPGRQEMTLLWFAISTKNFPAISELIAHGSKPDAQIVEGLGSAMYFAITNEDTRYLKAMLDGGLSPDTVDSDGTSLLQRAMEGNGAMERVKLLIEHHANINHRDSIGGTALDSALDVAKPDIAIFLVEHGADVNAHTTNGVSVAYSVQKDIDALQPEAKQATVTDISLDKDGQPVRTTQTPPAPGLSPEGKERLEKFERLRALMIAKGAKFPPDPPAKVREQMSKK